jgi:hypothetical protein
MGPSDESLALADALISQFGFTADRIQLAYAIMRHVEVEFADDKPSPAGQEVREQFEAWMTDVAKIVVGSSDPYPAGLERDYWRVWQAALASRQPVGHEPFAWISRIRCVGPEYGKEIYGKLPVQSLNPLYYEHIPLYAALPAQAVDLGQLQKFAAAAVEFFDHGYDGHGRAKLNELLALIDSQGGE